MTAKLVTLTAVALAGWFILASWTLVWAAPHFHIVLHDVDPNTAFWPVWWQNYRGLEWHINALVWMSAASTGLLVGLIYVGIAWLILRKDKNTNLYGTSEFAGQRAMQAGGIKTEKRR